MFFKFVSSVRVTTTSSIRYWALYENFQKENDYKYVWFIAGDFSVDCVSGDCVVGDFVDNPYDTSPVSLPIFLHVQAHRPHQQLIRSPFFAALHPALGLFCRCFCNLISIGKYCKPDNFCRQKCADTKKNNWKKFCRK